MKYYVFLDESGNTGTNFLDENQKIFSYGGWLIEEDKLKYVEELFENWSSKRQKAKEYKSNKLFKSEKSKVDTEKFILKIISENIALPFFQVFEKKFMVAAKIVETFFDSEYNPLLSNKITQPYEIKRQLANVIYNNEDETLEKFCDILNLNDNSFSNMKIIKNNLVNLFQSRKLSEVEFVIRNTTDKGLHGMVDEFVVISEPNHNKTFLTLTIPGIIVLFNNINLLSEISNADSVTVIHDQLKGYEEKFQYISENYFRNGRLLEINEINGRSISNNFTKLTHFEMQNSENSIFLQLADFLNGFLQNTIKKIYSSNEKLSILEKKIWDEILFRNKIVYEETNSAMFNISFTYDMEQRFFKLLNPDYELKNVEYENEIINNFYSFLR